jgi:hypothetical protein
VLTEKERAMKIDMPEWPNKLKDHAVVPAIGMMNEIKTAETPHTTRRQG